MKINFELGLTFDDVLLEPQYSEIESRKNVDIATHLGSLKLNLPILSANMDTVTELNMAQAMGENGGLGILHRYATKETVMNWLKELAPKHAFPSIGIKEDDFANAYTYRDYTESICVDVAHGDSQAVVMMLPRLVKLGYKNIMAGNVATPDAAIRLMRAGANIIKVGVGPGSACSTRIVTGHGVPQLTAIMNVVRVCKGDFSHTAAVVADGGIRSSGDMVKALAAGADAVMIGGLLAGTPESPAFNMGVYRGMASEVAQVDFKGSVSNSSAEGVAFNVPKKRSVKFLLEEFAGGIRSGLSYSGCETLEEFQENATFMQITGNGLAENHPHGLKK